MCQGLNTIKALSDRLSHKFSREEIQLIVRCLNGVLCTTATLSINILCAETCYEAHKKGVINMRYEDGSFAQRIMEITEQEAQDIIYASNAYWNSDRVDRLGEDDHKSW